MKTGLLPLTLTAISLGSFACGELLPAISTSTRGNDESSGSGTATDPTTMSTVDPTTTGNETSNVDTSEGDSRGTSMGETEAEGTTQGLSNHCSGQCGSNETVPGSDPPCSCGDECHTNDNCCPGLCDADVCGAERFCLTDTEVVSAGPALALALSDDAYDGTLESMACQTLEVFTDGVDTTADVSLEIGITHTYVGNLVIKVVSPDGIDPITVVSRPGQNEMNDDGASIGGTASGLLPSHPIRFYDRGPIDAESMGDSLPGGQFACVNDGLCDFFPNPGAATAGDFSTLAGHNAVGPWMVCVGDGEGGDSGIVDFVELTIDQVP